MRSKPASMLGSEIAWRKAIASSRARASTIVLVHHRDEPLEQMVAVGRTRARLGMVLHAEHGAAGAGEPLVAAVEQADMGHLDAGGQRLAVHREAMILAGDLDPPGGELLDRLVGAAMAAIELVGPPTQCQSEQLVTEADAEQRQIGIEHAPDRGNRVF